MGIALSVTGDKINIELTDYEIRGYSFAYKTPNSKYAKGAEDERSLKIVGDISRITENKFTALTLVRDWARQEYENDSYYNNVKVTHTYRDEMVREITFPNAFIKKYEETINPHTGHGVFSILLLQKFDKRTKIEVDPFNNKPINQGNTDIQAVPLGAMAMGASSIATSSIVGTKKLITDIEEITTEIYSETGNSGEFINFSDTITYGGNQKWYKDNLKMPNKNSTGCGSVAGANVLVYYAQQDYKGVGGKLLPDLATDLGIKSPSLNIQNSPKDYDPITIIKFSNFMNHLYDYYITQTIGIDISDSTEKLLGKNSYAVSAGVWFISTLTKGVKDYAAKRGVSLREFTCNNKDSSYEQAYKFIKNGLQNNCPVVMLVMFNEYAEKLKQDNWITSDKHYVTITRMTEKMLIEKEIDFQNNNQLLPANNAFKFNYRKIRDIGLVDFSVTISTWGKRNEIESFKSLWESKNITAEFGGNVSLAYFTT